MQPQVLFSDFKSHPFAKQMPSDLGALLVHVVGLTALDAHHGVFRGKIKENYP